MGLDDLISEAMNPEVQQKIKELQQRFYEDATGRKMHTSSPKQIRRFAEALQRYNKGLEELLGMSLKRKPTD